MKYFTKELWLGSNSEDRRDWARQQWDANLESYRKQLDELRPRLNEQLRNFVETESLHDGRLLSFCVGDRIDFDPNKGELYDINSRFIASVIMRVIGPDMNKVYMLKYEHVRKAVFDFPSDKPLFYFKEAGERIDDWGYDEITAANDEYLSHEVLFSSGTTIHIEFKNFSYEKVEFEGNRYSSTIKRNSRKCLQ